MMRLDKYLSHAGYGTRSEVKALIKQGLVSVNDVVIYKDDKKIDEANDEIIIDGTKSDYQKFVYIMLNKPNGYISSNFDHYHKTTKDLIKDFDHFKTFPVGRLDIDTEGLLILSNDGLLAHQLLSPKYHVDKTYYVEFRGDFKEIYYTLFETGITIDDGYTCMPSKIVLTGEKQAHLTIKEGKFHQVKRMFLALDMEVTYLKRVTFGPITLDETLEKGTYRLLSDLEIEALRQAVK